MERVWRTLALALATVPAIVLAASCTRTGQAQNSSSGNANDRGVPTSPTASPVPEKETAFAPTKNPLPVPPQSGPYTHKVCSATSQDGIIWTRDDGVRIEHASVPCAVVSDNRVLLYYVDADRGAGKPESTGCSVSTDGVSFQKQAFALDGMPLAKALDPCVVVDAQGVYRLYYLSSGAAGPGKDDKLHGIRMAVSEDGFNFRDSGAVFNYPGLVDPDVFHYKGKWFMYVFSEGKTIIATSADGRQFTYFQELALPGWGTTAPVLLDDGRLRLYAFDQKKQAGNVVNSFISTDGVNWTAEPGARLFAAQDGQITDPFVIRWRGGYKMYFKVQGVQTAPMVSPGGDGPWNHRVLLATSNDGMAWSISQELVIEQASVPELFTGKGGSLILLYVDASSKNPESLGAMVKQPKGTWAAAATNLKGADPNVVTLVDGSFRAYTKEKNGEIPVFSSPDGLNWQKIVTAFSDPRYPEATDPDVFQTPSGWVMLLSLGPRLLRCTSADGLSFIAGEVMELSGSVSDTVAVDGGWRTFFHVNANPQTVAWPKNKPVIWSMTSSKRILINRPDCMWIARGARLTPIPPDFRTVT